MKKYLVLLFSLIAMPVYAGVTVEVQALTPFASTDPPAAMQVKTMDKVAFENGITFKQPLAAGSCDLLPGPDYTSGYDLQALYCVWKYPTCGWPGTR